MKNKIDQHLLYKEGIKISNNVIKETYERRNDNSQQSY